MDDASFLQAIFDAPDDVATRLVYADWLEERGDIRGELLRARAALAGMPAEGRGRKELAEHERELVGRCDERWLVLLERAEWRKLYDELEPKGERRPRWASDKQAEIGDALAAFEKEFGVKLPRSYKAFTHVFGAGEMAGFFRFYAPCVKNPENDDLVTRHRDIREVEADGWIGEAAWLHKAVWIGDTVGGELLILDTGTITDAASRECRVCWLHRSRRVDRSADSLIRFIEDICMKVSEDDGEDTTRVFSPF